MMPPIQTNHPLKLILCISLILITLASFWEVQHNDFINLDDNLYIVDNPYVKKGLSISNIRWAFSEAYAGHWHPITWLSHMLDVKLFGLNPSGHHLVNLIFHIINALLLYHLFYKMTGGIWQSFFIAGLFALHPLRVESVAWAAERKDVLCGLFFFLTIYAYSYYLEKKSSVRYLLVFLSFGLALMSKPMAVTLPFVLLLLDYWPLARCRRDHLGLLKTTLNLIREKIPLFGLTIAMSILTYINHVKSGGVTSFEKLSLIVRIENSCLSYIQYLFKTFWPEPLAVLYPHPLYLPLWKVLGCAMLLLLITHAVIRFKKRHPYLFVGWFWYLGTLVPVIGIIQAGPQSMADRFTYIPHTGIMIMVVYGISALLNQKSLLKVAFITLGGVILLAFAHLTSLQVERWRDSITLFNHTLNVTSDNYLIHNNLGVTLMRGGKYQEAEVHFKKAVEVKPNYADAHHNLGTVFHLQGRHEAALQYLFYVLKLFPEKAETHHMIGGIYSKLGRLDEAQRHFLKAVEIRKDYGEAHYNLGTLYLHLGRTQKAIEHLSFSANIDPDNPKIHHNLGLAFQNLGRFKEAMEHFRTSLRMRPENPDTRFCLANLLLKQGKREEAILHLKETLKLNPNDREAQNLLFQTLRDF